MAVSDSVRRYYAEKIFALSGRDKAPPNFTPLDVPHTGISTVEGCRGGGKNILEISVVGEGDTIRDIRCSCGLCNPAMYVAADIVLDWVRGRSCAEILAVDPFQIAQLDPFYEGLGGPGKPDDAREKFQYALIAVQNAVRDHQGGSPMPLPEIEEPSDVDWAEAHT